MVKCSIIFCTFNSAAFLDKGLHSLLSQTLDDLEIIIVDDGSTDNTIYKIKEVLNHYPQRNNQVKLIIHTKNLGIAAARTSGIQAATGEYLIHMDSDDFIEPEMYELMYKKAKEGDYDIVACDYYFESKNKKIIISKNYESTPHECLKIINNKENCLTGTLWDKMVKTRIYKEYNILPFKQIDYNEDLNCFIRILYYSQSITVIRKPLYHHIKRENSVMDIDKVSNNEYWEMRRKSLDFLGKFFENKNQDSFLLCVDRWKLDFKLEILPYFQGPFMDWYKLYENTHKNILKFNYISRRGRVFLWLLFRNKILAYVFYKKRVISNL